MNFISELKRRNVIRMAGLYLVGAWLIVQVAATLLPVFEAPVWVMKSVVALLAIGFIPTLIVSWVFELTPDGLKREDDVLPTESIAPLVARRMDRLIIGVMALALGYFAVDKFVFAPAREQARAPAPVQAASTLVEAQQNTSTTPAPIDPKSVAVLAFANMSPDKDNEYFSDGVSEEILNALAQVQDLKVAGRTSSFYFKGRNEPLTVIGATLGVAHLLEGSVRKQGERLRITAQLIRVKDGFRLWAESFNGSDADIFALQENIARRVVNELKVALNAGQQNQLIDFGTSNSDAYAMYLRATDVFNKRESAQYESAMAELNQALKLDPQYARAHSRLATLNAVRVTASHPDQADALFVAATEQAQRALQLNADLAEPHAVLGYAYMTNRRFAEAAASYDQALQLDQNDSTANLWYAMMQCMTGYIRRCEQGLDRTLAIDPLLPNALAWRSRLYISAQDWEAATRTSELSNKQGLLSSSFSPVRIATHQGDLNKAKALTEAFIQTQSSGLPADAALVFTAARMGDVTARSKAKQLIDQYLAAKPQRINAMVPWMLIELGQIERGLAVFADHPSSNESRILGEILGTRLYPQVWSSPAYAEFLRKIKIAAYWDALGPPEHCKKNTAGDYQCQ